MNEQSRMNGNAIMNELPRMDIANLIQDIAFATEMLDINRIRAIDFSTTRDLHCSNRQVVLDSARKLVSALESPEEIVRKISKEPAGHAALRSALRMKIFEAFGMTASISARELAVKTGGEQLLI
ncbi:hypothetical protein MMC14_007683, partial [Varicellaria rhodocarpa]|nr:hypothetical protein [Varicellaria rhodocarpa]